MVDVAEYDVAEAGAVNWVLSSQRDAARTDDHDDESIERIRRHYVMDVKTHTAKTNALRVKNNNLRLLNCRHNAQLIQYKHPPRRTALHTAGLSTAKLLPHTAHSG